MSFNALSERTYTYDNAEILGRPGDKFKITDINLKPVNALAAGQPIRNIQIEAAGSALLMSLEETTADTYRDADGNETNFVRRDAIPRGYLSVEYDPDSGKNTFVRAELLVAAPDKLTERALGCLGIMRAHREEITRMDALAVWELLRITDPEAVIQAARKIA